MEVPMLTGARSVRSGTLALAAVLAVAGALAAGLAFPLPAIRAATTHEVMIVDFAFDPASLTIQVGDTVRWTNMGGRDHTATSTSGPASFSSPALASGETFEFTFTAVGAYAYHCSFHPEMTGAITVEEPAAPTAVPTPVPTQLATATPGETAAAEESALPDGSLVDRSGPDLGGLLWVLLSAVVLGGVVIASVRRT